MVKKLLKNIEFEEHKLDPDLIADIDQGIKSLSEGKGIEHNEVMMEFKKRYPTLKFKRLNTDNK